MNDDRLNSDQVGSRVDRELKNGKSVLSENRLRRFDRRRERTITRAEARVRLVERRILKFETRERESRGEIRDRV